MTVWSKKVYLGELNDTPLGDLRVTASDSGLLAVEWADSQPELDDYLSRLARPVEEDAEKLRPYTRELMEYLIGKRRKFTIAIDWDVLRPFQRRAMQAVYAI